MNKIYLDEEKEDTKKIAAPDALAEKFLKTRQILLSGEINKELAEKFNKQLLLLEADSNKPVYVYIDSPGGDVTAGFAIYDMIRFVKCPVVLIGNGLIASAAALILLAVPQNMRVGLPNSEYLIHQPLSGMRGTATDIQIHTANVKKTKAKINKIISEATGKDLKKVEADTDRDYWLDADEALEYGLISKIISNRDELKKIK
ncbi:MAG: ATP-dependent Clp protease proteolytic subunit [Treponema sp.]|uniref:ATP-dependent Clp protease proteolytic subunit n=1 Tax=Treponema sp. TaxID=166 RepID=UPI00298DC875|nr:ATP-dependent Clp protease proteolytic subunit [Treponema sp.]MCI5696598.1 ATP-dependent Clp protease proteolytic subunit [Spirochaetia bacterium]MDD5811000.1 ATP-dependent Clp protease proteolytic subunit [Treponema sp.]MDY5884774.1 ATP-dependent Clp protease proteolytic subunit [Treponema sp.]